MRIQQLRLENFRGFEELVLDFPEQRSTVFIGVNGAGKSSVLEAVGMLLNSLLQDVALFVSEYAYELNLSKDDIHYNQTKFLIQAKLNYHEIEFEYIINALKNDYENNITELANYIKLDLGNSYQHPFFIFFHSNRVFQVDNYSSNNNFLSQLTSFEKFIEWFEQRENLENQQKLERQDFNYVDKNLDNIRIALISFLNEIPNTHFSNLKMKRYEKKEKSGDFKPDVKSFLSITKNEQVFKIKQLSDGEKMSIMLVCDIARQLTLNNNLYFNNALKGEGIVLIDEIDLHLHPSWQRAIIPALEKTFPNIQFIVTTHSPQVLSTVKKENVFILEDFKLVEETPHTYGQDSNSILYNIFGINERPEQAAQDFKQLYRLIDDEKFQEAEKMLEEMSEKYGYYDSEIVRAKMHLEFNHH